jgi:hypothetical protein
LVNLGDWIGRACWWLCPLYDRMLSHVMTADKIFADDTGVPVLDPGRGKTKTGRFWCYAIDDLHCAAIRAFVRLKCRGGRMSLDRKIARLYRKA